MVGQNLPLSLWVYVYTCKSLFSTPHFFGSCDAKNTYMWRITPHRRSNEPFIILVSSFCEHTYTHSKHLPLVPLLPECVGENCCSQCLYDPFSFSMLFASVFLRGRHTTYACRGRFNGFVFVHVLFGRLLQRVCVFCITMKSTCVCVCVCACV